MTALTVRARACAKVNWVLEVVDRRPDGYHEVRTVIQTIDLCDALELQPTAELCLETRGEGLPSPAENLAMKAARLLQERAAGLPGARIRLSKAVPVAAGLGGGSSDAAAVLRGLNELWALGLEQEALADIAAHLGSDVPFFLRGGIALAGGRGERITPLPDAPRQELLIAVPRLTLADKTRRMYSLLTPADYTDGSAAGRLADAIGQGRPLEADARWDEHLFNVFDGPAFQTFPELERLRRALLEAGARSVHLAGSGPAVFTPASDAAQRERLAHAATQAGARAFVAATAPAAEAVALEVVTG
jgi:4-diphosphocytidyl-2-C-methyl-D-erythritol kinase